MEFRQDVDQAPNARGRGIGMNRAGWERAKELFSAAMDLDEEEREFFLQSQADLPDAIREVRSLLAAYEGSPDFLDEAALGLTVQSESPAPQETAEPKVMRRLEALLAWQGEQQPEFAVSEPKVPPAD